MELLSKVNDENQLPQTLHDAKRLMREILGAHKLVVKRQSIINETYQNSGTKRSSRYNRDDKFANNVRCRSFNMNQGVQSKKPWDNMECDKSEKDDVEKTNNRTKTELKIHITVI